MSARGRFFIVTINNIDQYEFSQQLTRADGELRDELRFCYWQMEKGREGTEHVQAYVGLKARQRESWLRNLFPDCHAEVRRGTHEQAREYVQKEDTRLYAGEEYTGPWFLGEDNVTEAAGDCNALLGVKRRIDAGEDVRSVAQNDEFFGVVMRHTRGLLWYADSLGHPRSWKTTTVVLYGASGVGKSRTAAAVCERLGGTPFYLTRPQAQGSLPWWDGYVVGSPVVVDDFYGWIRLDTLLRLTDRYAMQVEYKGGVKNFNSRIIIFTSNKEPEQWYRSGDFFPENFMRRVDYV